MRHHYATSVFVLALFIISQPLSAQDLSGQDPPVEDPSAQEMPAQQDAPTDAQDAAPPARAIDVEAARREILEEAPEELSALKLGDSGVSMELHGLWHPAITLTGGITSNRFGTQAAAGSPFLFEQKMDLTLGLRLFDHWFVEVNVQDDNLLNTYRAGYTDGKIVEYAGLGNTGLDFPRVPYLDLGGDSKTSVGFYGRFNTGQIKLHALVRYDAALAGESVFRGGRELSTHYRALSSMERGVYFQLPDTDISAPPIVYLEESAGWREALPSEVSVSARLGIVELAKRPAGRVAVYYPGGYNYGNFSDPSSFLGEVQAVFAPIQVSSYAPPSFIVQIGGKQALLLYETGFFSPFEAQNRYRAPQGTIDDASVVSIESDVRDPRFSLAPESEAVDGALYQLAAQGALDARWPLAGIDDSYKLMYLGDTSSVSGGIILRFTSSAQVSGYNIGTGIAAGSVNVYRGGLPVADFSFNKTSGDVTLNTPVEANEVIRITYLRESAERQAGSIAAGAGLTYSGDVFSAAAAAGVRWNLSGESFSEPGLSNAGRFGIGSRLSWEPPESDKAAFRAALTLGAGYEEHDTTGLYRAAGMEGNELIWKINESTTFEANPPSNDASLTAANRAPLVYRNYRSMDIFGTETIDDITASKPVESGIRGPYTASDRELGGLVIASEASLDAATPWAGFQAPLGSTSITLSQARSVEIPFHLYNVTNLSNIEVYAQFGALPGENSAAAENPALLVERQIYPPSAVSLPDTYTPGANNAALYTLFFTNTERRQLQGATHFRLVIKRAGGDVSGRVLVAPLIVRGAKFSPVTRDASGVIYGGAGSVTTLETVDPSLGAQFGNEIGRLHPNSAAQRVLEVRANGLAAGAYAGADGLVENLPLESYKALSFFFKAPTSPGDVLFFAGGARDAPERAALSAEIPSSAFTPGVWHKVTLDYRRREVLVDGAPTGTLVYKGGAKLEGNSSYIAVFSKIISGGNGTFSIDEICLEESVPEVWGSAGTALRWESRGSIFSIGNRAIIESAAFETAIESGARIPAAADAEYGVSGAFESRSHAETVILKTNLGGSFNYAAKSGTKPVWSGGHVVGRRFGPLNLSEDFFITPEDASWNHNIALNLRTLFQFSLASRLDENRSRYRRSWDAGLGFSAGVFSLSVDSSAQWTQKSEYRAADGNYGAVWVGSFTGIVPDNGEGALERAMRGNARLQLGTKPIGAAFSFVPSHTANMQSRSSAGSTSMNLSLPWQAGRVSGSASFNRVWTSAALSPGNKALDDLRFYGESLERGASHLFSPPFYSTFAESTAEMPDAGNAAAESFQDKSRLSFDLPPFFGIKSIFIPSNFEVEIERSIDRRYDTLRDTFVMGAAARFSQNALFGAYGKTPIFKFYQSDEWTTMLSYHLRLPKKEAAAWDVTIDQDIWFFGFYGSTLSLSDTIVVGSDAPLVTAALNWTVKQTQNLAGRLYQAVTSRFSGNSYSPLLAFLADANPDRLRSTQLKFSYKGGAKPVTTVSARQESIVRAGGYLNFSLFLSLDLTADSASKTTTITASAGTALRLSF